MSSIVHPVSAGLSNADGMRQLATKNWRIIIYYCLALTFNVGMFVPGIRAAAHKDSLVKISQSSTFWFSVSVILSIPNLIEFTLDSLVSFLYPTYQRNLMDHRFGHGLILISLFLPILIIISSELTEDMDMSMSFCFVNFCCGLALAAVFGKMNVFSKGSWKPFMSLVVFSFYLVSQNVLMLGIVDCDNPYTDCHPTRKTVLSILFALVALLIHIFFGNCCLRLIWLAPFSMKERNVSSYEYKCFALFWIVALLLALRVVLLCIYYKSNYQADTLESTQIVVNIIFALAATVLPGRMVRRDVVALKREMDNKKTFIRYISHEIRSPLSTTSLGLDYLIEQMSTGQLTHDEVLEVVRDAKTTCEIATNTLNDLLMFDKIETGMLEVVTTELNAWDFVTESVKPFLTQATSSGILLSCTNTLSENIAEINSNKDSLDDSSTVVTTRHIAFNSSLKHDGHNQHEIKVKIDKHKMDQVIRNFLTNALKFTSQNSGIITVTTSIQSDFSSSTHKNTNHAHKNSRNFGKNRLFGGNNAVLRVQVVDNGPGISAENLPKLFGQYVQFDANILQGGKGSGLGLWLSKAIVEMHGGIIGATSEGAGKGCTFYLEIPCTLTLHNTLQQQNALQSNAVQHSPSHQNHSSHHITSHAVANIGSGTDNHIVQNNYQDFKRNDCDNQFFDQRCDVENQYGRTCYQSFSNADTLKKHSIHMPNNSVTAKNTVSVRDNTICVDGKRTANSKNNKSYNNHNYCSDKYSDNSKDSNNDHCNINSSTLLNTSPPKVNEILRVCSVDDDTGTTHMGAEGTTTATTSIAMTINTSNIVDTTSNVNSVSNNCSYKNSLFGHSNKRFPIMQPLILPQESPTFKKSLSSNLSHNNTNIISNNTTNNSGKNISNNISSLHHNSNSLSNIVSAPSPKSRILSGPIKQSPKCIVKDFFPELKVLLVDDSNIARKMVDRALTRAGVQCFHACNGLEAVQLVSDTANTTKYDVILMDCFMPVMNGPEAVRAIKNSESAYTGIIVALSGSSVDGEFKPLLGQGVDRILMKPFNVDAFFAAVYDVLSQRAT